MSKLLDILLQRNDPEVPWGFRVRGGADFGSHPIISSVTFGTLAADYLNAGDKILKIDERKANTLPESEIARLIEDDYPKLHLLVEKLSPSRDGAQNKVNFAPLNETRTLPKLAEANGFQETFSKQEWVKEKETSGNTKSTKIWLRETNRDPSLGEYDLEVNFERTKFGDDSEMADLKKSRGKSRNRKRLEVMSENFDDFFREKFGNWLEANMLNGSAGKQQSSTSPSADGAPSFQPPPPPPPSFPGAIPGRRIKTEIPEKSLEPPSVIQNAMMTKDKKPFTYTPGGIDLSEIRSPKMQRRINRNACADEMPGIPAPTTNQPLPVSPSTNPHFSAMQSQLPAQVLPLGVVPPPPPPPPPGSAATNGTSAPPPPPSAPSASSNPLPKPASGRPPLGFDPNELLARVNKAQPYEPPAREETLRNFKPQPPMEEKNFEPKQQKSSEIGQNVHVPVQNEPGHIYVPQVTSKKQNEMPSSYTPPAAANNTPRAQLGSIYVPPVATVNQEQSTPPPTSPYGYKVQQTPPPAPIASPPEDKPQAPWVTVYRTPQSTAPWASRESEPAKQPGTRIIPIQIEGRDSPKPATPSPQPQTTPPPFLQSQQMRQQQQQQAMRQQQPAPQHQPSNTRVIPIQIEGNSQPANNQPRSPGTTFNQNKFNPMTPQSPTPYSPSQEREQKPQWASVQPRPFKKEQEVLVQRPQQETVRPQQPQPEYGTYNTAGVPLSQLRKMQLSDDDRALMDKFKSQVEKEGNDISSDKSSNLRYRGGCIPSKVFKILDESVDEEKYLHNESDPRYRGACIPSRAFKMLQSMTDTAGDMPQQVPRTQQRAPTSRPLSGGQFQQEAPSGPYVPPSGQQAQEPRKYTGGSIPSRSFRILQAMTGQEVSAPSGPPSGRETPVFGVNRWCPSPSPSPIDPYWGYYPPDPYYIYNYISDINAAYGFPPPPPPPFHPYYHLYQSCSSDNDELGYSSTDELAQYNANFRKTFGYSPFQPNHERYSTPSFNASRGCPTPISGKCKIDQTQKSKISSPIEETEIMMETKLSKDTQTDDNEEEETSTEESDSDTEIEEGDESLQKTSSLQTLKSVPNVNVYTSESSSTVVQEDEREDESSDDESEEKEDVPHQLSVIFEESEHSDVESIKRMESREPASTISESESCSTLDNGDDDSDGDTIDPESSVTVRLPLKFQYKENDDVMTVTVGDSQLERDTVYDLKPKEKEMEEEEEEEEESNESDEGDISVTFTLPSRSNSVISVERAESLKQGTEVEAEVTVHVPLRTPLTKDEKLLEKTDSPLADDSNCTIKPAIFKEKQDAGDKIEVPAMESFSSWIEKENGKDWKETEKTETILEDSIKAGVGKLEEMISSLVETTKDVMSSSMELEKDLEPKKLKKKDSQEESEEDDSGVTSDMSIKQLNSETDADTESDYSELSKMTKFQRASTHSRLFKLLQEECERCGNEEDDDSTSGAEKNTDLTLRKQNLTLPLNQTFPSEVESLSSSSGMASPCSPIVSDRLVKELIHSLLNKKKGKKFRNLPMGKLHAAALKILQEEMEYDTSPTSGDDGLFLSPMQKKKLHSKITAKFADPDGMETLEPVPESIYGENYYDYLDYYNTWINPETYNPEDYIVPSRAFRTLREQTSSPVPKAGFIGKCPRVASKKNIPEPPSGRQTPVVLTANKQSENEPEYEKMTFAEKQEQVSKVLEKSGKS